VVNLIIMFEMTMLFDPRGGPHPARRAPARPAAALYDPAIMDGKILVGVVNPAIRGRRARARLTWHEIRRSGN
jgi:hypothetical protein